MYGCGFLFFYSSYSLLMQIEEEIKNESDLDLFLMENNKK